MFDPPEVRADVGPTRRLAPALLAGLLALPTVPACAGSAPEALAIGELLPLLRTVVPQTDVFSDSGDAALLGTGTLVRETSRLGKLLVARGHRTEVGFRATGSADLSIDVRMRRAPRDHAPKRTFRMLLDGTEILSGTVPSAWRRLIADVPAEQVRPGVNRLQLVFSTAPDDPLDEPVVPARIRRIRVRPAVRSVAWPERPTSIETDAEGDLVMPVNSLAEVALHLPGEARLRGTLVGTPVRGQRPRPLQASVRVRAGPALGADGRLQMADEHGRSPGEPPDAEAPRSEETALQLSVPPDGEGHHDLDLDLSPWAGRLVTLSLEVAGPGNGTLTWADLRLEHAPGQRPEPLPRAPAAPASVPASGIFAGHDVILILLDAARADAFSAYGAGRPTPAVDALASEGVLFERAVVAAPWTAPSVTTLLTGLFADTHGVESWERALPKAVPTLAELFRAAGYRTVAWSQHILYRTHPTLRRGFDEVLGVDPEERDLLPEISELLAEGGPSFVLVHLLVPHAPYTPPAPWADRYADPTADITVDPADPAFARPFQRNWDPLEPGAADVAFLRDRYDETVAWADSLVGRLITGLRSGNRYDDALLILTADHGEAFWEHGDFLHTRVLHEEVLRVPLIARLPGGRHAGSRWPDTVSLADVPATLVDAAGLPPPARLSETPEPEATGPEATGDVRMQGRSLMPILTGAGHGPSGADHASRLAAASGYATTRAALFRRHPGRRLLTLESHGHKLLVDTVWDDTRLYDVRVTATGSRDAETTDLAAFRPVLALWLRQAAMAQHLVDRALLHAYGAPDDPTGVDLDLSDLEALESLGYLR